MFFEMQAALCTPLFRLKSFAVCADPRGYLPKTETSPVAKTSGYRTSELRSEKHDTLLKQQGRFWPHGQMLNLIGSLHCSQFDYHAHCERLR